MSWIRRHRLDAFAIVSIVAGVVLLALVLLPMLSSDGDAAATEAVDEPPVLGPYSSLEDGASPDPDATPGGDAAAAAPGSTAGQVADGLSAFGRSATLPGLGGSGGTAGLPRHELTITFTSAAPISGVGYQIPTSEKDFYGIAEDVGTSWSLRTAVYGDPDYAQGFAQAGARGTPITCTITVDGRVTERRSTDGPYGQLFCQG